MSEPTKAPDPRVSAIEENGVTFPLLMLDQNEQVEQAVRKCLLQHFAEIAEVTACAPAERFALVADRVPAFVDLNDVFQWAQTAHGIRHILTKSIGDKPDVINRYIGIDGANMAMSVTGYAARLQPEEIAARRRDIAERMAGIRRLEDELAARKAALDDEPTTQAKGEDRDSPPGASVTSE